MRMRHIVAGLIVALLLSASSLSAACDLSCAFASLNSDCHSRQMKTTPSASNEMKMGGMDMAGMAMPEIAGDSGRQTVSADSPARGAHPSIGEMGPCEKQSCDGSSAVLSVTVRNFDSHFHFTFAVTEIPLAHAALELFHGARDGIEVLRVHDTSPQSLSLRI